jgi:Fe-S cluster biogenesis protein NfuA
VNKDAILAITEDALDKTVRPLLREHNGNIAVHSFEDGILRVKMTGGCAGCPSAVSEVEHLAGEEIKRLVPEVNSVLVVTGVSDELLEAARSILKKKHPVI